MKNEKNLSYVSLFSGAWVWCYGFKMEWYDCISTLEIIERRLNIQKCNNKCSDKDGYILWDIKDPNIKNKLIENINTYKRKYGDLDVLIATPPCQWMSVANHKKWDELWRNSLVVESIKLIKETSPKFFIFENVSAFLKTTCTDIDWIDKPIEDAIDINLSGMYNIFWKVINFKNYWSNSSRTRTLVIWVRKDLKNITPLDIFPAQEPEKTLYDVIWDLPSLKIMWEISKDDIYHWFREYSEYMREWIHDLKEWESAFDNKDPNKRPHKIVDWEIIENQRKNADKYTRQIYNKVAPCIHTRNDILASQNTIHPKDDRVFSIRELMRMMTIPESFSRSQLWFDKLNRLSFKEKKAFLKKEEINIRQSIWEWVPTIIFKKIAENIKNKLEEQKISNKEINDFIENYDLKNISKLKNFIKDNPKHLPYNILLIVAELANSNRIENAAYYTSQDIVFWIIKWLPNFKNKKSISILEPSVWIWAFLPLLIRKYEDVEDVQIDVIDIDKDSLDILRILLWKINIPDNIHINYFEDDFLKRKISKRYEIVIWNPPYWKVSDKNLLKDYLKVVKNNKTNNIFAFFIEKALDIWELISFIVPKSLLNAPDFDLTRDILKNYFINSIIDFGEKWFAWVKIETINIMITTKNKSNPYVKIASYILNNTRYVDQQYIIDSNFPYWLIYRNDFFDKTSSKLQFNIFKSYRDRQITKKHTKEKWKFRVLKSRNIGSNEIINIPWYDCFIDDIEQFGVKKYMNSKCSVLVPNLTYYPRACFLPNNSVTDWSVAILTANEWVKISKKDLEYFWTQEFSEFYKIARNLWTRSLNIDNNSVFYFWKLKK